MDCVQLATLRVTEKVVEFSPHLSMASGVTHGERDGRLQEHGRSLRATIFLLGRAHAEWETFCNYHRPHGALGGQTPYERLACIFVILVR